MQRARAEEIHVSIEQYRRGVYVISTEPERLDGQAIHAYLSCSYSFAPPIPSRT
jgi:hypothetical protein